MAFLGSILGRALTLAVAGTVGFIASGPVGAGVAMSQVLVIHWWGKHESTIFSV